MYKEPIKYRKDKYNERRKSEKAKDLRYLEGILETTVAADFCIGRGVSGMFTSP